MPAPATDARVSFGVGTGFRFGIGFFLAATVFSVLSFIVWMLILSSMVGALAAGVAGLTSPGASIFQGSGVAVSEPTWLSGDVGIEWTATDPDGGGCHLGAVASRADRPIARETVVDTTIASQDRGTYQLRGLADADYLLDVQSDCAWSFRFVR